MSKRNMRRTRKDWQKLFTRQERSSQTQAAFCKAEGVGLSAFQNALKRSRQSAKFVEVSPAERWESEVTFPNGMTIRVRSV